MTLQSITRNRDGKVCAYYVEGNVSAFEFHEMLQEVLPAVPDISQVYYEHWRLSPRKNGRGTQNILKCKPDAPGAFPVTGVDVAKWRR